MANFGQKLSFSAHIAPQSHQELDSQILFLGVIKLKLLIKHTKRIGDIPRFFVKIESFRPPGPNFDQFLTKNFWSYDPYETIPPDFSSQMPLFRIIKAYSIDFIKKNNPQIVTSRKKTNFSDHLDPILTNFGEFFFEKPPLPKKFPP